MTCVLAKNTGKAFFHVAKIYCLVMTLHEVFNRLQAFLFFLLWGINVGMEGKSRAEHRFLARSRILPQRINSREIGETCQQN